MDIPINVDVFCQGESCGHTMGVVLNPVTDVVTHIVVKESDAPNTQRLVPIDLILDSTLQAVHLKCDTGKLQSLKPFIDVEYIRANVPHYTAAKGFKLCSLPVSHFR